MATRLALIIQILLSAEYLWRNARIQSKSFKRTCLLVVECWMLSKYNVHCERPWPLWAWGSAHFVWISRRPLCTTESKLALGWRPPHNQSRHRHFRWPHDYWGASLKVHKGHPAEYPLFQPEKKIKFSILKLWRFNFSCNSFILRISNLLYKMEHLQNLLKK